MNPDAPRFKIEFSGRDYPDYYPSSMVIFASDQEAAMRWAEDQLAARGISGKRVDVRVTAVESTPQEPAKGRRHGTGR